MSHYRMLDYLAKFEPAIIAFGYGDDASDCEAWCAAREDAFGLPAQFDAGGCRVFHVSTLDHRVTVLGAGG